MKESIATKKEKSVIEKETQVGVREHEEINEVFFRQYIETGMENELFKQITEAGFSDEEIQELRKKFSHFDETQKEYAYAFPYELRKKNFSFQSGSIHSGKRNLDNFWDPILENGIKNGRRLGYHCSLFDIKPTITRDGFGKPVESWEVKGTENDHRNNDMPMAYYAEDYMHIYRTKSANFLYIISSPRATGSGHYADNTNKWGRAPNLSVIQKFNLRDVDDFVRERSQEYFNKKNAPEK